MFNEINRIRILWMVFRLWLSVDCFVFNSYRNHSSLVLRRGYGTANILDIREGVTQGYLMDMVVYGIGIILLIKKLKLTYPDIT